MPKISLLVITQLNKKKNLLFLFENKEKRKEREKKEKKRVKRENN